MKVEDELAKMQERYRLIHEAREKEVDSILFWFARLPYSGIMTIIIIFLLLLAGYLAGYLVYGYPFNV